MEKYIVIACTEDGVTIESLDKAELEERISENYYGGDLEWAGALPPESDPSYWGTVGVIIKGGSVVAPEAVETVTKWEV